jgi:hypothetical protein
MRKTLVQSGTVRLIIAVFVVPLLWNEIAANPVLTTGIWKDITPAAARTSAQGFLALAIDHSHPSTVYAGSCGQGIWKTTDAGSNWVQLGNASQLGTNYAKTTTYIDNPVFIDVDPNNSNHLYSCHTGWCGSGQTIGFWVSNDAGVNWTMTLQIPAGITGGSDDVGGYVVDPANFNHILLSLHYTPDDQFGFMESKDAGITWSVHPYPTHVPGGTKGLFFLHSPENNLGNENTWLMSTEQAGFWRTSDAGATWTNVAPTLSGVHGGLREHYYSKTGVLYTGGVPYPSRSTDNGLTWQQIPGGSGHYGFYGYYGNVCGDGDNLYITNGGASATVVTSPETDGLNWTLSATIPNGPGMMRFDATNHIMYATAFVTNAGIWALKTQGTSGTAAANLRQANYGRNAAANRVVRMAGMQNAKTMAPRSPAAFYNVKGEKIGRTANTGLQIVMVKVN